MRLPGLAIALALNTSCTLEPNGGPEGALDTEEVLPKIVDGTIHQVSIFSKLAYVDRSRSTFLQRDEVRAREGRRVGQVPLGALSMTLSRGTIRPTFCDTMTFQRDSFGAPILSGASVAAAYADAGILVSAVQLGTLTPGLPIAFDSSNPTGDDADLATPGPGYNNDRMLGNLLIKAENTIDADGDGRIDQPDDDAAGTVVTFDFLQEKCVARADLVDVEDAERPARVELFGAQDQLIDQVEAGGLGDNSVEQVFIDTCGVRRMNVALQASGALHDVTVCNNPEPQIDVNMDIDLNNIVELDFEVTIYLENSAQLVEISGSRLNLDPIRAISGGALPPLPIASGALVPTGTYDRVRIELSDLKATAFDGSRLALPGSVMKVVDHSFEVRDCGLTTMIAEWTIDSRIEGDALGLGLGLTFANPANRHDAAGCRP